LKLSVVIITKNEEENLPRCLASVSWADEIVLIDSDSTDRTLAIAESHGARVYRHDWHGFGPAKREAVSRAKGEWIFSIDADEEVSPALAQEIKNCIGNSGEANGFYVPRLTQFLGKWMRHGGWYPDYVLRLFKKDAGNFTEAAVHETVVVEGATERLEHHLRHYCYPSLESYFVKFNRYTELAAQELHDNRQRAGWARIILNPIAKFIKQYILRAGFLDGLEGLVLALLSSGYVLTKYAKLRDLQRQSQDG
jgi:glycosyltransferase involved in cell wall biosynthesis